MSFVQFDKSQNTDSAAFSLQQLVDSKDLRVGSRSSPTVVMTHFVLPALLGEDKVSSIRLTGP